MLEGSGDMSAESLEKGLTYLKPSAVCWVILVNDLHVQGLSQESQTAAIVLGLLTLPIVAWSEVTLKTTGSLTSELSFHLHLPRVICLSSKTVRDIACSRGTSLSTSFHVISCNFGAAQHWKLEICNAVCLSTVKVLFSYFSIA